VGKRSNSSSSALMATLSGDIQRLNCSKALHEKTTLNNYIHTKII